MIRGNVSTQTLKTSLMIATCYQNNYKPWVRRDLQIDHVWTQQTYCSLENRKCDSQMKHWPSAYSQVLHLNTTNIQVTESQMQFTNKTFTFWIFANVACLSTTNIRVTGKLQMRTTTQNCQWFHMHRFNNIETNNIETRWMPKSSHIDNAQILNPKYTKPSWLWSLALSVLLTVIKCSFCSWPLFASCRMSRFFLCV